MQAIFQLMLGLKQQINKYNKYRDMKALIPVSRILSHLSVITE